MHDRILLKLQSPFIFNKKILFCPPIGGGLGPLGPLVYASGAPFGWGAQGPDAGKDGTDHQLLFQRAFRS